MQEEIKNLIPRPEVSVAQIVLLILSEGGRMSFVAVMGHPLVRTLGAIRSENSFYTALARLKRRRFIVRTADHRYELTPSGEYAALKSSVRKGFTDFEKSANPHAWDGKWRIVFFDVPESRRPIRDYIRTVLKRFGFCEFQRSIWAYPYKLPLFLSGLLADPQMRKYTRLITTYDIDYDEDLRRRFKLL